MNGTVNDEAGERNSLGNLDERLVDDCCSDNVERMILGQGVGGFIPR
jgi:hypothetical protein